jgi:lipoprotein-releasing system ATP-binding protein
MIIQAKNIVKRFQGSSVDVLSDVSLEIQAGELIAITGKSGSGKSTLLYVLSTMDRAYSGSLSFFGESVQGWSLNKLAEFRGANIGFVFQFHYLLSHFTVLQNVMMPAIRLGQKSEKEIRLDALEKLRILGVEELAEKPADKISGGQQQRVAIARALINNPRIIMADEPTGNLDSENAENVMDIFERLRREQNQTILVVTHDQEFASRCTRKIDMRDGRILN